MMIKITTGSRFGGASKGMSQINDEDKEKAALTGDESFIDVVYKDAHMLILTQ